VERLAEEVGREVARRDTVLVCGGLGGVMRGAARGAKAEGGLTLGILPGERAGAANDFIDIVIPTGMGEARNALVVRACDAIVAVHGGYGTLSEIALALKAGIPVVGLETWQVSEDVIVAQSPEEAVAIAIRAAESR
ncbi:MAG: TIGR00725 family protein, partial [Deltaproteobacteria bacterium RBG_13_65_10]